jgi:hypothetical protein
MYGWMQARLGAGGHWQRCQQVRTIKTLNEQDADYTAEQLMIKVRILMLMLLDGKCMRSLLGAGVVGRHWE